MSLALALMVVNTPMMVAVLTGTLWPLLALAVTYPAAVRIARSGL